MATGSSNMKTKERYKVVDNFKSGLGSKKNPTEHHEIHYSKMEGILNHYKSNKRSLLTKTDRLGKQSIIQRFKKTPEITLKKLQRSTKWGFMEEWQEIKAIALRRKKSTHLDFVKSQLPR